MKDDRAKRTLKKYADVQWTEEIDHLIGGLLPNPAASDPTLFAATDPEISAGSNSLISAASDPGIPSAQESSDTLAGSVFSSSRIVFTLIAGLLLFTALAKLSMLLTDPFADVRVGISKEIRIRSWSLKYVAVHSVNASFKPAQFHGVKCHVSCPNRQSS